MNGEEPAVSAPLDREVLSAQVKDRILQWIVEGKLAPGERIVETRMARELGVSQAPVREALRDLAHLGVVDVQPYRGASVRVPSKAELIEAMEVRGELEALAAPLAAKRISQDELAQLRRLIDEMRACAERNEIHEHALRNTEFHALTMRASGNRTLERLWQLLDPLARTYVTASVPGTDLVWLGRRHEAILDALESGDGERAASVMREHSREAEELLDTTEDLGLGQA